MTSLENQQFKVASTRQFPYLGPPSGDGHLEDRLVRVEGAGVDDTDLAGVAHLLVRGVADLRWVMALTGEVAGLTMFPE